MVLVDAGKGFPGTAVDGSQHRVPFVGWDKGAPLSQVRQFGHGIAGEFGASLIVAQHLAHPVGDDDEGLCPVDHLVGLDVARCRRGLASTFASAKQQGNGASCSGCADGEC